VSQTNVREERLIAACDFLVNEPELHPDGILVHLVGLSGGKSPAGVTRQRQDFFDDSSRSLDVGKSATGKPARGGDRVSRLGGPLQERDLAERAVIEANEAEDREREIRKLLAGGQAPTRRQAEEILDREAQDARRSKGRAPIPNAPSLVASRPKTKWACARSRPSTAVRNPVLGAKPKRAWFCNECHLERYEHRPKAAGGRSASIDRSLEAHIDFHRCKENDSRSLTRDV
jgi:hypothetical protein